MGRRRKPRTWFQRAMWAADLAIGSVGSRYTTGMKDRFGRDIGHGMHVFVRQGTHHGHEAKVVGRTPQHINPLLVVNLYERGERVPVPHTVPARWTEVVVA